jgi:hypothetical protein
VSRGALPNDQLLAGCCRAGAAAAGSRAAAAAERLPVADLQSKPADDWSRLLIELLAPIKACLARAPGTVTRVTKAWPMNKAMTGPGGCRGMDFSQPHSCRAAQRERP